MELLNNPYVRAALTGVLAAAAVDIAAFRSWKSIDDALSYSWNLALWRWGQGAIVGLISAVGLGAVS